MKSVPPRYCFALTAALALLVGCAGNKSWQPRPDNHARIDVGNATGAERHVDRWVVEFDEQGELHDREQLTEALEGIQKTPGKILLIVFVHGWQNDASYATNDLRHFEQHLLKRVANSPRVVDEGFKVVGVYIGWRGGLYHTRANDPKRKEGALNVADVALSVPKVGSFFTRKSATQRLGGNVGLTDSLYRLSEAAKYVPGNMAQKRHDNGVSRVIMIGHSFGGAILEEFLKTTIAARQRSGNGVTLQSPADLFLLVNSATEASHAQQFQTLLPAYSSTTPPMVISVSSEGDFPNRVAFWTAKHLVGIIPALSGGFKGKEGLYFGRTSGHVSQLLSHWARRATPAEKERLGSPAGDAFEKNLDGVTRVEEEDGSKVFAFRAQEGKPLDVGEQGSSSSDWWVLSKRDPRGNPLGNETRYWVIKVPNDIVKGHVGLYNEASYDLMAALFRIANPFPRGEVPTKAPEMKLLAPEQVATQEQQYKQRTPLQKPVPPTSPPDSRPIKPETDAAATPAPLKPTRRQRSADT